MHLVAPIPEFPRAGVPGTSAVRSSKSRVPRAGERGGALVETAFTVPILMIIVLGMCGFAFVFNQYLELTLATNAAAEQVSFARGAQNTDVCNIAYLAASQVSPVLTSSKLIFTVTVNGVTAISATSGGTSKVTCNTTAVQNAMSSGHAAAATVTLQYAVSTPFTFFLSSLIKFSPMPGFTMQSQVTEMIQ